MEFKNGMFPVTNRFNFSKSNWCNLQLCVLQTEKRFRCHVDACKVSVAEKLTQLSSHGKKRAIAYFLKRMSSVEEKYSANNREIIGIIYIWQKSSCYLEGKEFEVFADNKGAANFYTKPQLTRKEAWRLEFIELFKINSLRLVRGKTHVLDDALSRIPQCANPDISAVNSLIKEEALLNTPSRFKENMKKILISVSYITHSPEKFPSIPFYLTASKTSSLYLSWIMILFFTRTKFAFEAVTGKKLLK